MVGVIPCITEHPLAEDRVKLPVLVVDWIVKLHSSAKMAALSLSSPMIIELEPFKSIVRLSLPINIGLFSSAPSSVSVFDCLS